MRILFAIAAMAAMIGFAQPAQAQDWRFYLGLEGGYGWNSSDATVGAATPSLDVDGFTGGAFAGVETGVGGGWTLGFEGDWKYADGDETNLGYTLEQNWTASVRGRASYEVALNTQVFGTLGWGWADVDARVGGGASQSETLDGFTAGVGLQHDYGDHLFGRIEYRYTDYDDGSFATAPASTADLSSNEVLIAFGWKFGA